MGRKCCFTNCRSGTGKSYEDVTMFRAPKDQQLFEKWRDVLLQQKSYLLAQSVVCIKHFRPDEIVREVVKKNSSGIVIFRRTLKIKKLVNGAVPSIFEDKRSDEHIGLSDDINGHARANDTKAEQENNADVNFIIANKNSRSFDLHVENILPDECTPQSKKQDVLFEEVTPAPKNNTFLFTDIFSNINDLKFPNPSWGYHRLYTPTKILVISKLSRPIYNNLSSPPINTIQVVFEERKEMQIFILNKLYNYDKAKPTDFQQLQELLEELNNIKVCVGGPNIYEYANVSPRCAYKDLTNKWRHISCTLICSGVICNYCNRLDDTLRHHLTAATKRKSTRLHIPISPSKKIKIEMLRKAVRLKSQTVNRYKRKLLELKKLS